MSTKAATQRDSILADLELRRKLRMPPLTPLDALRDHGCMRLAARIHELRAEGYDIRKDMEGGHAAYTLYLREKPQQEELF